MNACRTVASLLQQDYPNLQVIFVDDGSRDNTFKTVSETFAGDPHVQVHTKPNGGKASALNYGIHIANSDFVICIDADTQLKNNAVSELMKKFTGEEIAAVAGNVKVGNEVNLITRWQSIEYITSQNFDRRAFELLNCITVVPGAIGAFRKDAVIKAGALPPIPSPKTATLPCAFTAMAMRYNCNEAISVYRSAAGEYEAIPEANVSGGALVVMLSETPGCSIQSPL